MADAMEVDAAPVRRTVAFVVNLFKDGFSLDSQDIQYPYKSALGEELMVSLNTCQLSPAIELLVHELRPIYDEGALTVEVRDYRHDVDAANPSYSNEPQIHRIKLRPNAHTLYSDLSAIPAFKQLSDDLLIQAEAAILNATKAVCIDPSSQCFEEVHTASFNRLKFNFEQPTGANSFMSLLVPKRTVTRPQEVYDEDGEERITYARSKLGVVPFLNRIGQCGVPCIEEAYFHRHQIQYAAKLNFADAARQRTPAQRPTITVAPSPQPNLDVPADHAKRLQKARFHFTVNKGQDFVVFEILPKANGCFDGRLRVGPNPDQGTNGDYSERFSLGNSESAWQFFCTLQEVENQDSEQLKRSLHAMAVQQQPRPPPQQHGQSHGQPAPGPVVGPPQQPVTPHQMIDPKTGAPVMRRPQPGVQPGMQPGLQPGAPQRMPMPTGQPMASNMAGRMLPRGPQMPSTEQGQFRPMTQGGKTIGQGGKGKAPAGKGVSRGVPPPMTTPTYPPNHPRTNMAQMNQQNQLRRAGGAPPPYPPQGQVPHPMAGKSPAMHTSQVLPPQPSGKRPGVAPPGRAGPTPKTKAPAAATPRKGTRTRRRKRNDSSDEEFTA